VIAPRRPLTRLGLAGLASHAFFELASGVGMPLASVIGPKRAAGLWACVTGVLWRKAGSTGLDRWFDLLNGFGMAAVLAHLTAWPRRRTRLGLPWLVECEGLGPDAMRFYNPILYFSAAACALALVSENRDAPKGFALVPVAFVPLLAAWQHAEHRRLKRIAAEAPAWWNRRLAATG
jgi:hypothetical protein